MCTEPLPLHLGVKPGVPVAFAAHLVRGYLRWKARQGASAFVLFAEISAAFYAAVRQLAAPVLASTVEQICRGLQLSEGDIEELRQRIKEPCALAREHAPAWLQAVAARIHSATWMTIADTGADPMATHRGTRPGSSWADIMFAAILRRVLQCRDAARGCDVTPLVPWDGTKNPFICGPPRSHVPLSADDISTCCDLGSASRVEAGAVHEAGVLTDAFQSFGMQLNFAPNKTAGLVAVRGPGAKQVRADLF